MLATLLLLLLVGLTAAGFAGDVLIDCASHSKSKRFDISSCASLQLYFNLLCISMVENTIAFMWTRQQTSQCIIVVVNAACTGTFVFANPPLVCVCLVSQCCLFAASSKSTNKCEFGSHGSMVRVMT